MARAFLTSLLLFVLGAGAGAAGLYQFGHHLLPVAEPTNPGPSAPNPAVRVVARGRIEPAGGVINVGAATPDRLRKFEIEEGAAVTAGQVLAYLDSHQMQQSQKELADIQLREARNRLAQGEKSSDLQIAAAQSRLEQLEKQAPLDHDAQVAKIRALREQLKQTEDLLTQMKSVGTYPQQDVNRQTLLASQAREELNAAEILLKKTDAANTAAIMAARNDVALARSARERLVSEAPIQSLQKSIELAQERLELTLIRAPVAGKVLKRLANPGETVGARPVLQMADVSRMVVLAEVHENDVANLRDWLAGAPLRAKIHARALAGRELVGTVEHIGSMVSRNTVFSMDPTADADSRVVEVRVRISDKHAGDAANFINLQVEVTIPKPTGAEAE